MTESSLPVLIAVKLKDHGRDQYVRVNNLEPFARLCGKTAGATHPAHIVRAFAVAFSQGNLTSQPKLFCSTLVSK